MSAISKDDVVAKIALSKYDEAMVVIEESLVKCRNTDAEYASVAELLSDLVKDTKKEAMVPINQGVYLPVEIIHTNEVLVLLGDDWFAELSVHRALQLIERRRGSISREISRLEGEAAKLRSGRDMISRAIDGESKLLEIREEYMENMKSEEEVIFEDSSIKHDALNLNEGTRRTYDDLDASEKKLLSSLDSYMEGSAFANELNETGLKSALVSNSSSSNNGPKKSVTFNLDRSTHELHSESVSNPKKQCVPAISQSIRDTNESSRSIVKEVVERDISDEGEEDSEGDDIILGLQLSQEYNTKRTNMIASDLISNGDEYFLSGSNHNSTSSSTNSVIKHIDMSS